MNTDTTTWGVQPNGFYTPTQEDLLAKIQQDQQTYIDIAFDISPDSPEGQNSGIFSRQLALAWEAIAALNAAQSRDGAEGDLLTRAGTLVGTPRNGPSTTKVVCSVTLEAGTTLEAGVSLASLVNKPDVLFTPTETHTAVLSGTVSLVFEAVEPGPIPCPAGQLTVISTPTTGWLGVGNPEVGVLGSVGDTLDDPAYRLRQVQDLARAGSSTAAALAVDLVYDAATGAGVPGVLDAWVLENDTDYTDANGVPPHAIEPVLYLDGTQVASQLARAIWEGKKAGTPTAGSSSASFTDDTGETRTVYYTEVVQRPVYLSYTLTTGTGYVGAPAVKSYLVDYLTTRYGVGADVLYLVARAAPLVLTGVTDVPTMTLGFAPAPIGVANLSIGPREIATFAAGNITVA